MREGYLGGWWEVESVFWVVSSSFLGDEKENAQ
jgi:hypothetical protein